MKFAHFLSFGLMATIATTTHAEKYKWTFPFRGCEFCSDNTEPPKRVGNGEEVILKWDVGDDHNVWKFDDVNAYKECDTSQASVVCGDPGSPELPLTGCDGGVCECTIPTDTNGVSYYACLYVGERGSHCTGGGMKVAVVVNNGARNLRGQDDE